MSAIKSPLEKVIFSLYLTSLSQSRDKWAIYKEEFSLSLVGFSCQASVAGAWAAQVTKANRPIQPWPKWVQFKSEPFYCGYGMDRNSQTLTLHSQGPPEATSKNRGRLPNHFSTLLWTAVYKPDKGRTEQSVGGDKMYMHECTDTLWSGVSDTSKTFVLNTSYLKP